MIESPGCSRADLILESLDYWGRDVAHDQMAMVEHLMVDPRHVNNEVAVQRTQNMFNVGNTSDGCPMSIFSAEGHFATDYIQVWKIGNITFGIRHATTGGYLCPTKQTV